ncbi:Acetyl-CoA hydrolase/transferase family protein [Desulfonema limicola]|uniref:Acetyl-CoA hydrolase/transferase family protein n=1 Tax=Desulfonema limicola TaxID=45656 RepID=A0A975B894_9BACT|nr:bifunctional acetyl-CoA hydrolase/transferase family protein/GNAT family N-acetyltransferase [Desulfonema limicola]QTA80604.1 Acetyl-CoA hydrolase/transferase family protein [Desulfonema limicola]
MKYNSYWADDYIEKRRSAAKAMELICSGQRIFIGSFCGQPQYLEQQLADSASRFANLEIVRIMSMEGSPLTQIANKSQEQNVSIRNIYLGSAKSLDLAPNMRFYTPVNMSEVPNLFTSRRIPIDVAMIQVTPPDDFGWMSLGVSVDVGMAAALSADIVIAQVNTKMPKVMGKSFIHVNDVTAVVEHDEDLLTITKPPATKADEQIGLHIARLIEDGSTLQIGLDAASQATSKALLEKNDLGIHSAFLTDDIMRLYSIGVVNNHKKGFNEGKLVASSAVGTQMLYEFLDFNPAVDFYPTDYVNDIEIISRHNKMVSMNVARYMDLTGQVSADASSYTLYAGVSGIPDFVRGSNRSKGGKSIIMLNSVTEDGKQSRIVPLLNNTITTVPREDVRYVVTEYGAVNIFGKSTQERALAMISLAHPDFRDQLLESAKEIGMIGKERTLGDSVHGIYPVKLEEIVEIQGQEVTLRPVKTVDERRIQEHFYNMDRKDILSRFFHEKRKFYRQDIQDMFHIDYIRNLTIVALVGDFGFGRVVGMGEYYLNPAMNMAEVSFSISKEFQGYGLGKMLIRKLAEAARENGFTGVFAYTSRSNHRMINLFKSLPYKVNTTIEDDLELTCRFDEPL